MEVVIVPKAHLSVAVGQPWHELIQAARSGESGMAVVSEYQKAFVIPKTNPPETEMRTVQIGPDKMGSPYAEHDACPKGHAVVYERRGQTYLHFQNW